MRYELVTNRWTWRQYYEYLGTLEEPKKGFFARLMGR
jgi:hypothetical protein